MLRAPVIITTLCRYKHLKNCIQSLEKNRLAKETEVYIGLDYPLKQTHEEGYFQIKEYLNNTSFAFKKVNVIMQRENQGWYGNFLSVREQVYKKYDSFIYVEDDNEFAIGYLEYMNLCLDKYREDESVYAVAGYRYPVENENVVYGNAFRMNSYFSASGYGVWKSKEINMYEALTYENFSKMFYDICFVMSLAKESKNQFCNFVRGMLEYKCYLIKNGEVEKIDLAFGLWMFRKKWDMIFPTQSLVKNCGYDGTGENCEKTQFEKGKRITSRNYDYSKQVIKDDLDIRNIIELGKEDTQRMKKQINSFFYISTVEYFKAIVAYGFSIIFGIKSIKEILNRKLS